MATGSPVSFWYGTRAQFDSIETKLDTTLYFITDEQALYKGTVKFSGSGVDTLLTISATEPTASSVTTGDKYFNTSDNLIHVLKNEDGTITTTATYEPANGALYYNADAQRFQTLIKDGSSYIPTDIYDAGISVEDGTGLVLKGTTVGGLDATTNSKGVVQVGSNLNVSDGVLSVPTATNARFGVVETGDNITNMNGVISVAKATTSSLGVVKPGDNINVDNNGQISVPVANDNTKGVVSAGENVNNNNGVFSVSTASTDTKGVVEVGTNIDVDDGVISVKDASTSDKGVVQLTNTDSDLDSETTAITPNLVNILIKDVIAAKQDNLSNGNVTTLNTAVGAKIDVNVGDGLDVGVAGSTNANKLIVNEASVKEVLEDVVDGGTEPAVNEIVTAGNLRGALSVGQAVDVSCPALSSMFEISVDGGTSFVDTSSDLYKSRYLDTTILRATNISGSGAQYRIGFITNYLFPKRAPNLKYIMIVDVCNTGDTNLNSCSLYGVVGSGDTTIPNVPRTLPNTALRRHQTTFTRIACIFSGDDARSTLYITANAGSTVQFTIKNWRQYEVTALTDEAIAYIAQLPDPDAFFRSQSFSDISGKYLVKADMVNPWTYLIGMPTNSPAMTVGSGLAYQLSLTDGAEHEITVDTFPKDAYGQDSHIQLLLANNSTAVFKSPLNLVDALIPNAANNITVKFRAGQANVYLDDTDAGYVVTVTAGTENGSLYYGITGSTSGYIIFNRTTDESSVVLVDGTTVTRPISVVGNGADKTEIVSDVIYVSLPKTSDSFNITNATINTRIIQSNPGQEHRYDAYVNIANCKICDIVTESVIYESNGSFIDCEIAGNTSGGYMIGNTSTSFRNLMKNCYIHDNYNTGNGITYMTVWDNCVFENNRTCDMFAFGGGTITGCTVSKTRNTTSVLLRGNNNYIADSKFLTAAGYIRMGNNSTDTTTLTINGYNVLNTLISTGYVASSTIRIVAGCTIDLSGNTYAYVMSQATSASESTPGGINIGVYASTASDAVVGGTATVLYSSALDGELDSNNEPFTKSRTISGGGANYIMRSNGAIGVPVTTTTAGQAGSLDTLLDDSSIEQITFAPVVDGQTITIPDGTTASVGCLVNGAGRTKTVLTGTLYAIANPGKTTITFDGSHFVDMRLKPATNASTIIGLTNCHITCNTASEFNAAYIKPQLYNCVIDGTRNTTYPILTYNGGACILKNCIFMSTNTFTGEIKDVNCQGSTNITNCIFNHTIQYVAGSISSGIGNIKYSLFNCSTANALEIGSYGNSETTVEITGCTFTSGNIVFKKACQLSVKDTNIINTVVSGVGNTTLRDASMLNLKTNTNENVISGGTVSVPANATVTIIPYGATQASQYVTIEGGANGKTGTYIKNTGENDLA